MINWDLRIAVDKLGVERVAWSDWDWKGEEPHGDGVSWDGKFAVKEDHPEEEYVALHELAHLVLKHSDQALREEITSAMGIFAAKAWREVSAELAALLAGDALGINFNEDEAMWYIAGYAELMTGPQLQSAKELAMLAATKIVLAGKE